MGDGQVAKPATATFTIPRQLLADLLAAEREYLALKTNATRNHFLHLSRALLSAMELSAAHGALPEKWPPDPPGGSSAGPGPSTL